MAKVAFTKLGLKRKDEVKTVNINNNVIEVKQYLPINDKLALISRVINLSHDSSNNFANPVQVEVIGTIEIIAAYTKTIIERINISAKADIKGIRLDHLVL